MDVRLYCAARSGNVDELINLANSSPNILQSMAPGSNTILHIAARGGHVDFVMETMGRLPSLVTQANDQGDTPLHFAARTGWLEVVELLMTQVDITSLRSTNDMGNTVLIEAITNRQWHVATILLEMYHSTNDPAQLEEIKALVRTADKHGQNALHNVARHDDEEIASMLFVIEPLLAYISDNDGLSPLHIAATFGSAKIFELLVKSYPDTIEQLDAKGRNALQISVINGWLDPVVKTWESSPLLRSAIEEVDREEGNTLLHLAVKHGNVPLARWLSKNTDLELVISKDGVTGFNLFDSGTGADEVEEAILNADRRPKYFLVPNMQRNPYKKVNRSKYLERTQKSLNSFMVVAALVATVTFAATFTAPGGYNSSGNNEKGRGSRDGSAMLVKMASFKAFLLFNTLATCCSLCALIWFIYLVIFYQSAHAQPHVIAIYFAGQGGISLTCYAVVGMLASMITGVYAMVGPECLWLAIAICAITLLPGVHIFSAAIWATKDFGLMQLRILRSTVISSA